MIIDNNLLDKVSQDAVLSPRLRMNYNFHEDLNSNAQRLLNALEPGTVVPVHRHQDTAETCMVVRGSLKVFYYDENRNITDEYVLNPLQGQYGIHIPKYQWHSIEVLESGTVIFEVKDGPYMPLCPEDILE